MPEKLLKVIFTARALADSITIKNFILVKFTHREVDKFYKLIFNFEKVISVFPELYPKSFKSIDLHRAVLSKQLSVFYTVSNNTVFVIAMIDNRMDYSKWP